MTRTLWGWVLLILAAKIYFIFAVPLTGDEAYFIRWAEHLDFGYYDHPPMVGWLIWLMSFFAEGMEWFRFFSLATSGVITWLLYTTLKPDDETKAGLIALLFWSAPVNLLLVPFTNDVALTFFGLFSTLFFIRAVQGDAYKQALLNGAFLGLAFLSKYFAVVLFFGMVVYLVYAKGKQFYRLLSAVILGALPFGLVNLYWNMCNCWDNIMFNVYNRHGAADGGVEQLALYLVIVVYFLLPWNLYAFFRTPREGQGSVYHAYRLLFATALVFFGLLSLRSEVGAHWLLLFIPFGFALFSVVDAEKLKRLVRYTAAFSVVHILLIGTVLNLPLSFWEENPSYKGVVLFDKTEAVCEGLETYRQKGALVAAYGYTESALLTYHCGYEVPTLFSPSKYGRLDDKAFDTRRADGRDIVLLHANRVDPDEMTKYGRYFDTVRLEKLDVLGAKFNLVVGETFRFETYREYFLAMIKAKFYTIPEYLPMRECHFLDRYFKDETTRP